MNKSKFYKWDRTLNGNFRGVVFGEHSPGYRKQFQFRKFKYQEKEKEEEEEEEALGG